MKTMQLCKDLLSNVRGLWNVAKYGKFGVKR